MCTSSGSNSSSTTLGERALGPLGVVGPLESIVKQIADHPRDANPFVLVVQKLAVLARQVLARGIDEDLVPFVLQRMGQSRNHDLDAGPLLGQILMRDECDLHERLPR
jgi:hypothetical protein